MEPVAVKKLMQLTDQYSPAHRQWLQRAISQRVTAAGLCAMCEFMAAKIEGK